MATNDFTNFKLDLIDELSKQPVFDRRGSNQYSIRCPMCGDSRKSRRSTHFYIAISPYEDTPVLCHCFLCLSGGMLTPTMLKHMDILDIDLNSGLTSLNKHIGATQKKYRSIGKKKKYKTPYPVGDKLDEKKRDYINKRLGLNLSFEELFKLKTIFSLGDFIRCNEIETLTCHDDKALALDEDYVGFMTAHNEYINFRKVNPKSKYKRYEKYGIESGMMNTVRFYVIPTKIDLLTTDMIHIHIAEGVFDILGVYYHLHNGGMENSVYCAITGVDYKSVIDHFIREGFVGNVTIHMYKDTSASDRFFKNFNSIYGVWVEEIFVYQNELDDDFGVPKDRIEVSKRKLR